LRSICSTGISRGLPVSAGSMRGEGGGAVKAREGSRDSSPLPKARRLAGSATVLIVLTSNHLQRLLRIWSRSGGGNHYPYGQNFTLTSLFAAALRAFALGLSTLWRRSSSLVNSV